jgi:hypothetical protein
MLYLLHRLVEMSFAGNDDYKTVDYTLFIPQVSVCSQVTQLCDLHIELWEVPLSLSYGYKV